MRFKSRTSLEARLCVLTVGTLFVLLLGLGHFAIREQTQSLVREKQRGFESIARALALSAEPIIQDDSGFVSEMLSQRLKNSNWDLRYVIIADESGQVIYARSTRAQPEKEALFGQAPWRVVRSLAGYEGVDSSQLYKVTVPVKLSDDRWGTISTGFSMARVQALVDESQSRVMLIFAIALFVGIVCSIVFARSVTNLLKSIIRGAHAVADGNLSYRVPMTRVADELSHLVEAFNYMIDTISNTHHHLVEKINTDTLTGLYNHKHFHERLETEFSRTLRHSHQLSLLFIDIDRFRDFNLQHGHDAGDAALAELGDIIRQTVRDIDICARYGGEQFAIALPESDQRAAIATAERIHQTVQEHIFPVDAGSGCLTVSIGVATAPAHAADIDGLLVAVDVAIHRAKAEGGDKVIGYRPDAPSYPAVDPCNLYTILHTGETDSVASIASSIDTKHGFPEGHSKAVAELAASIALKMNLPDSDISATYLAGLLRDIGQIAVPDEILLKGKALTSKERRTISLHPKLGHSILEKSQHLKMVLPGVLHHHERYDGTGYPDGLAGADIPRIGRILAVADAYQSMIAGRPHRKKSTPEEAAAEITRLSATQFDPEVVQAFKTVLTGLEKKQEAA